MFAQSADQTPLGKWEGSEFNNPSLPPAQYTASLDDAAQLSSGRGRQQWQHFHTWPPYFTWMVVKEAAGAGGVGYIAVSTRRTRTRGSSSERITSLFTKCWGVYRIWLFILLANDQFVYAAISKSAYLQLYLCYQQVKHKTIPYIISKILLSIRRLLLFVS